MRKSVVSALPTLATVLVASLSAAQTATVLDPVVVSASHLPTQLSRTTSSSSTIEREEILARNPASVLELLETVPGLHINRVGGIGGTSSIFIRGADPNFTLILVDGVPVNDPTDSRGGTFDLSAVNPLSLERIEVVRGPLSSVYGSQALGGVINLITRGGSGDMAASLSGGLGSQGYSRAGATLAAPVAEVGSLAVTVGRYEAGAGTEGTDLDGSDLTGKLQLALPGDASLAVSGRFAAKDARRFPDDSGGPLFAERRATDRRETEEGVLALDLSRPMNTIWTANVGASYARAANRTTTPGVAPGRRDPFGLPAGETYDVFERTTGVLTNVLALSPELDVTLGGDAKRETGDSEGFLDFFGLRLPTSFALDRTTFGGFLEARYGGVSGLTIDAAIRIDKPEGGEAEWSPRVGATYRIDTTATTLRTSWAEGFKLPSFYSLGNPLVGNPNLRPETNRSFDIGIQQGFLGERLTIGLAAFHNRFFNLVDFDPGPPPRLVNRSEVLSRGLELEIDFTVTDRLHISGFAQRTQTEIEATGEQLRSRPKWRGGGRASWQVSDAWTVQASAVAVGRTRDSSIPTGDVTLDSYVVVDLGISWQATEQWQISAAVGNLFDADYQDAVGFPANGISGRIETRLTF